MRLTHAVEQSPSRVFRNFGVPQADTQVFRSALHCVIKHCQQLVVVVLTGNRMVDLVQMDGFIKQN